MMRDGQVEGEVYTSQRLRRSHPLKGNKMKRVLSLAALVAAIATPAFAHDGIGSTASFAAGIAHPVSGLDHITVMVAVGLWAALKGGRALWVWPATFVGLMLVGWALGMTHMPIPFVEPGIVASVVALGLLVALAIDLPVAAGAAIIGVFSLLHGHAHGAEVAENVGGIEYMAGFALATALLHATGIASALLMQRAALRPLIRVAGGVSVLVGVGLFAEFI
jgi:urease accessory protein